MATTLLDNLNSDYLAAFSALRPSSLPRVLVYVESDDDIAFWRHILTPFEKNRLSFDIQLPRRNALEKGKTAVLQFANRAGKHLILCLDSDYDYLLQDLTDTSTLINSHSFIFQTYSYSMENLTCYASSLHNVCVGSSKNDHKVIDFEELMKLYSRTIYKLFLWSVYFPSIKDTTSFTLTEFCEIVKILDKVELSENFATAFEGLTNRVNAKLQTLETTFSAHLPEVERLSQSLQLLGVEADNVYLFAHGHTIKDNVTLMFLKVVFKHLVDEKFGQITANAHEKELVNQRNFYKKQITPIEDVLSLNTEFKDCFLYQKISEDLSRYIRNF